MKFEMEQRQTADGNEGELIFSGELTVVHSAATRKVLLEALDTVDTLYLDLRGVEELDVSFVQLVCATHREVHGRGKAIYLKENSGGIIRPLLERSGYFKQLGCSGDARESCLWQAFC